MIFNKYKTRGAYHYDWYRDNTFDYRDCVDKCVDFCKGSTLDIGGGEGLVTRLIKDNGHSALNLELEQEALNLSSKIDPYTNFVKTDLEDRKSIREAINDPKEPYKQKFEFMVCLNVIEHLEHPENIKYIFDRYITKAAIIITDIPQGDLPPEHFYEYTPYELKQMFHTRKVIPFTIGKDFHGIEVYK